MCIRDRSGNTGGLTWAQVTTDLVGDTSPQLGGDLDLNSNDITGTGNINITGELTIGGSDLNMIGSSDGNRYFDARVGTDSLQIRATSGGDSNHTNMAKFFGGGAVELYYANSKKLETNNSGAQIFSNLEVGNTAAPFLIESTTNGSGTEDIGRVGINRTNSSTSDRQIWLEYTVGANESSAAIQARSANDTGTAGTYLKVDAVNGNVDIPRDSCELQIGAGNDLKIYHDGTDSFLSNSTGTLFTLADAVSFKNAANNEVLFYANANHEFAAYYNNSKKFETTSTGVEVTGSYCVFSGAMGSTENIKIANTTSGGYIQIGMQQQDSDGLHHRAYIKAYKGGANIAGKLELLARGSGGGTDRGFFIDAANYIESSLTIQPTADNSYNLGSSSKRWANIYTNDLNLSNEGSSNDVDGTWGDWTMQEGESDLFLKNNRSGKKYKFNLTEVS